MEDTIDLAGMLPDHGVDLVDVSVIGNAPVQPGLNAAQPLRSDVSMFSVAVKEVVGSNSLVGFVGGYADGNTVVETLEQVKADVILVGDLGVATLDGVNQNVPANGGTGLHGVAGRAAAV
ncbi:hypothetical protein JAAARDRAFT_200952 [Jaapia argillacea MUCL 33604]|uniref:Uncharacterized protein n=1 Tax=Jaapia argillacea MUCL 33604 TaxID=933084 RepID=A0A067PFR3_9AGAM|nr:hypothetical protein JAAARDRAFT_200952 [Jaapia argillacea MUCL 33604]